MKYIEDFQISPVWDSELAIRGRQIIYNEIWVNHEYSRFGVEVKEGDIVVDCGANVGMFSQYAIHKGASKVFSYECGDEEYKYLQINTADTDKIITKKGYVSDIDYNIKKILEENNLDFIDFLKIDIEGSEFPLLINEDFETLKKVKKIAIEFHIFGKFNGVTEYYDKMLYVFERLSLCGFKLNLEHMQKNVNTYMVYASK